MDSNIIARRKGNTGNVEGYGVVSSAVINKYTFQLDTELGAPEEYRDLTNILLNATENDEIHLMLNGPGGYLSTCAQLVNLIQNSDAQVIAHLIGPIASAHTFIFLACPAWIVYPHSSMLLHSYSGGAYEKGKNILLMAQATQEFFEELVADIYYPFLTEEEVERIIDGKDIHLHSKSILPRLETLTEYRESLFIQQEEQPVRVN